jgi:four helix bundle protein
MGYAQSAPVTPEELQERTLAFALAVYEFVRPLFREPDTRHIAQQLLRCSAAVAANYRAACLARSFKEWTAKLGVVREEADEVLFWLVFLRRAGLSPSLRPATDPLIEEAAQLARIFAASYRTSSKRIKERTQRDGSSGKIVK